MKRNLKKKILSLLLAISMLSMSATMLSVSAADMPYSASNDFSEESSTVETAVDGIYVRHGYSGMNAAVGTNMTYEAGGYYKMNNLGVSINPIAIHLGALEAGTYKASVDVKLAEAVSVSAQLTATLNTGAHGNGSATYQYTEVTGMSLDSSYNRYAVTSSSENFPTTSSWKTIELTFVVPEGDTRTDWVVSIGNQNVATYIDNVEVNEVVEGGEEPEDPNAPYSASNDFSEESSTVETAVDGIYVRHGYSGMNAAVGTNMTYEAGGYYKMNNLGNSINPIAIHLGALDAGTYKASVDVKLAEAVSGSAQLTATLNVGAHDGSAKTYQYTEVTGMSLDSSYNRYAVTSSSENFPTTSSWKTIELTFVVPEGDTRTDWVVSIGNQNVATYIDNVEVNEVVESGEEPEEPTPEDPEEPEEPTPDAPYSASNNFNTESSTVETAVNGIYVKHGYSGMNAAVGTNVLYDANGYYVLNNMGATTMNPMAIHMGALEAGEYKATVDVKLQSAPTSAAKVAATLNVAAHDNNDKTYQYTSVTDMTIDSTYKRYEMLSSNDAFPTTDEWKTIELTFVVPEGDTRTDWVISIGSQNVVMYVDNFVINEVVEGGENPEEPEEPELYSASNGFSTNTDSAETAVNGIYVRHGYSSMNGNFGTYMSYEADGYYKMNNLGANTVNPVAIHLGALEAGEYKATVDVKLAEAFSGSAKLTATLNVGAHDANVKTYQYTSVTDMAIESQFNRYEMLSSNDAFPTTSSWKTIELTFVVPEGDTRTDWVVSIGSQNIVLCLDNVTVNEVEPVVTEPGFGDLSLDLVSVMAEGASLDGVADMAGKTVTFTTKVTNNVSEARTCIIITAVYDSNACMIGFDVADSETVLASQGEATATTTVSLTSVESTAGAYVRTFAWSDLDTIVPYAEELDPFAQ